MTHSADLTEADKGYLAGLIDGEGCIFISKYTSKRTPTPIYSLTLVVAQANEAYLRHWQEKTGLGKVFAAKKKDNPNCSNAYQWRLNAADAQALLIEVYNYLVLKKEEARIALQFQSKKRKRGGFGGKLPEEVIREREAYKQMLSRKQGKGRERRMDHLCNDK